MDPQLTQWVATTTLTGHYYRPTKKKNTMNLNQVNLIGRVTKQPELKKLPSGTSVVSFAIATNHNYKKESGEKVETTSFHNCKAFGKVADTIGQYVVKGQELFVDGRIEYRQWDKTDGTKGYATEILVNNFQFGQKPQGATGGQQTTRTTQNDGYDELGGPDEDPDGDIDPADIPF